MSLKVEKNRSEGIKKKEEEEGKETNLEYNMDRGKEIKKKRGTWGGDN